jgi:hypothetical protein
LLQVFSYIKDANLSIKVFFLIIWDGGSITFEARKALKAQTFADFLAEFTLSNVEPCSRWTVFTYGSSNTRGGGVG